MFFSFEMVADGKQHMVELLAIRKNFTLRVDGGVARSIINEGSRDYLRLTSPLYIGGIPSEPGAEAFNHFHLRNLTSFNGQWIRTILMIIYENFMHSIWRKTGNRIIRASTIRIRVA